MLFTSALILTAASFAIAAPAASDVVLFQPTPIHAILAPGEVPESVANATALGIDLWGPIPDDAVLLSEGKYEIIEGTKAAAWLRAQGDLEPYEDALEARGYTAHIARRQGSGFANIGLGLYQGGNCNGNGFYFDNVVYNNFNVGSNNANHYSLIIARRGIRRGEYLDLLRTNDAGDWCGSYLITFVGDTGTGCTGVNAVHCFRLHL